MLLLFTQTTFWLLAVFVGFAVFLLARRNQQKDVDAPPSPMALPIIGHLHLLGGYEVPYQAFTDLGRKYGDLVALKLGSVASLVVNGQRNIREILVTKGNQFDSRPNFERYQQIFGGDKENSLAFCNWSDKQKVRRDMLKAYTFPRAFTNKFNSLDDIILNNTSSMLSRLNASTPFAIKPLILETCANVFTSHFCSREFHHEDPSFVRMIENFDEIFYEVNQGYAADFLPFLLPLHKKNLQRICGFTHEIRDFITESLVGDRRSGFSGEEPADYVESLIQHVEGGGEAPMSWDTAMYALEDIIGGHSAVGNYVLKVLAYLVKEPTVQRKVQEEIDACTWNGEEWRAVRISDRNVMPYTEAVLFEAIRLIASPIVPRVANQDTYVNGYKIKKDTLIFLNNYDLSMSPELWTNPTAFQPERFLQDGRVVKPDHFLPFGGGRRSCMGYKMVQLTGFGIISTLLQRYTICPVEGEEYKVPVGSLALPKDTYKFSFTERRR